MYSGAGKDEVDPRRNCGRHVAIRHADVRSVALGSVPGGAGQLRNGSRERFECRRLQAAYAGYRVNGGYLAAVDAVGGVWGEVVPSPELLVASLGRESIAPFSFRQIKLTTQR